MVLAQPPLETPRISLRPAAPADARLLLRWRAEPSVRRYQPLAQLSLSQLRVDLAAQRIGDLYRALADKFQWIVVVDDEPAGWITLVVSNWEHGLAEVGYALSGHYQGKGVMTWALTFLLEDLFANTDLERIEARCAVDNRSSQRVLEKVGFRREGLLRAYFRLRNRRVDNILYAVLRSDYLHG